MFGQWNSEMTLHNEREECSAELDICGTTVDFRCPSIVQLEGSVRHYEPSKYLFVRNLGNIRPIHYIIDVGASIGGTALMFRVAFPNARILAIEPVSINYEYLLHNTKDISQITTMKVAAYNNRCRTRISMPLAEQRKELRRGFGNPGLFSIYGKDIAHSEMVEADTLDNVSGGPVGLLKIDVEGAEMSVLEGAKRIIAEDRPIIIIELRQGNIAMSGNTLKEYEDYFVAANYTLIGSYMSDPVFCPGEIAKNYENSNSL